MSKANSEELLKEYKFLTYLIKTHEADKEKKMKASIAQQNFNSLLTQNSYTKHSFSSLKLNNEPSSSFNKPLFQKTNQFRMPDKSNRIFINKSKYVLQKNQNSNKFSYSNGSNPKTNVFVKNSVPSGKKALPSEIKSEKSNSCEKINTGKFVEEVESLTQRIKNKISENKLTVIPAANENKVQSKLSAAFNNTNCFSKYKTVNGRNVFSKIRSLNNIPLNLSSNISERNSIKQTECSKKLNPVPSRHFNFNKYSYKNSHSEISNKPLSVVESKDPAKNMLPKRLVELSVNKTNFSESKNVENKLHLLADKQNLTVRLNMTKDSVSLESKLSTKSCQGQVVKVPIQPDIKTSSMCKSPKISKLKSCSSRYTKINKHLITPKANSLKRVITPKSIKKVNRKVNTKYKVINKHHTLLNKKSSSSEAKENTSEIVDEPDSIFQKDDSAHEKYLFVFTASVNTAVTPVSSKVGCGTEPNSTTKVTSKLSSHKMSQKKSKARISNYKIVNVSNLQNCLQAKKQNTAILKTCMKKVNCSKYKLVNKHLRPLQVSTSQGKSVLVKRLFKSKNVLINKNASPTNFSAKMIKSKYITLNKRKSHLWQKNCLYTKVPLRHGELKGYYLKAKLPSQNGQFQKTAVRSWKATRKFSSYHSQAVSKQFSKNSSTRKLKNGYPCLPVVSIRGVKYSTNSTGKTLKKLPVRRGHLTKIVRKTTFGGRAIMKTPENLMKYSVPTSNFTNRVLHLHRRINKILSASIKKSLTKVNTYCMFYNRFGRCNNGVKCTYIHDPSKIAVCTRFLRGTCKVDGCPFSHEIAPGKMALCPYFLVGGCIKANCPYRHEKLSPNAVLCKAFVQGYCPKGKECKKAHILVCPKYIQGECDKGSSCPFPHPPRKVKKNVLKNDEEVEKKPDDVLMEKVARYFQTENSLSSGNKSNEGVANQYVPKQRKLEEQPSFIPLFDTPKTSHS